ncbi:MAG: CAP domain-containing protein [Sphingomonadales bacterium]|nr:CAP domain-containing protein [Sphingomonadales bacterium]
MLAAHNRERWEQGVPALQWSEQLARSARRWANHLSATGSFYHSDDEPGVAPQGENLWAGTRGYYSPESMVGLWAAEKGVFRPGVFPMNSRTGDVEAVGHYTQLMWRRSTAVGCALAHGRDEDFLVCRYATAGNVIGQLPF